jgi:hypothetical protein
MRSRIEVDDVIVLLLVGGLTVPVFAFAIVMVITALTGNTP